MSVDTVFNEFLQSHPVKRVKKGEIVIYQGEVPRSAYIIKSGIVKTYNISASGDEKPVTFDVPTEIFPTTWVFNKTPSALYFYEAYTDCELFTIPRDEFLAFIKENKEVLFTLLDHYVTSYAGQTMRINALEYSKATDKVLHTMYYLCLRFGKQTNDTTSEIHLPLSQQDLANLMGLTRETTSIELKKLQRSGIITYKRQSYSVKLNKLTELIGEEELRELKLRV